MYYFTICIIYYDFRKTATTKLFTILILDIIEFSHLIECDTYNKMGMLIILIKHINVLVMMKKNLLTLLFSISMLVLL